MSQEGETPKVVQPMDCPGDGSGRLYPHYWRWKPDENGQPSNTLKCSTCSKEYTPKSLEGKQ